MFFSLFFGVRTSLASKAPSQDPGEATEMACKRQIVALAVLGVSATAEAFAPGVGMPTYRRESMQRRASGLSMQQKEGDFRLDKPKMGVRPSDVALTAVLDPATDEARASPAASTALDTKTILRVPWGASGGASSVTTELKVQNSETLQAPVSDSEMQAVPAVKAVAKPKQETTEEPNEFAMMALKAGFLKQSSPLIMSQMAGNKGFDPAGFAKSPDLLLQYREAELKHARLAMLASVGWVMSELWHTGLADLLGKDNLLQEDAGEFLAKAPSVLNGGLQNVPPFFWLVTLLFTGVAEATRMLSIQGKAMTFTPGAVGFDPLGFYEQESAKGKLELELKEINNGRLAMIAIAFFAAAEFFGNTAIVDQTPFLFTEGPLSNAGNLGGLLEQYSGLLSCKSGLVYCSDGQDAMQAMFQVCKRAEAGGAGIQGGGGKSACVCLLHGKVV